MRVFITGSTGYIGGAVARELIRCGHYVAGLFRGTNPDRLPCGVIPVSGELFGDTRSAWIKLAATHDVFIHCAWDPTVPYEEHHRKEEAMLNEVLAEAAKPDATLSCAIITTSGSGVLGQPEPDETAAIDKTEESQRPRFEVERRFLAAGTPKLRTCSVRPTWVYGGTGGNLKLFAQMATLAGKPPPVVGGGAQAMPLVHVNDLARLYVMVATNPRCTGAFHAVNEHTTWREFMTALSKAGGLGGKVTELSTEEGIAQLGIIGRLMNSNLRVVAMRPAKFGFRFNEPKLMPNFDRFYREALA